MTQKTSDPRKLFEILKTLWRNPCLVLVIGTWRAGKTDFSLLLSYLSWKWKLIDRVAGNIHLLPHRHPDFPYEYITNLPRLKRWLHQDRSKKLFVFDEALTHLPSRRAMSKMNVDFGKMITQISKGHGRMIFCSQTQDVDSVIKKPAFLRCQIEKLQKKTAQFTSDQFSQVTFFSIPKSPIRFDPDVLAEFSEYEPLTYDKNNPEVYVSRLYVDGFSLTKIEKETGIHRQQVKRLLQKGLRAWLESIGIQKVNLPESAPSSERASN